MKRFFLTICALCISLIWVSCSSEDDNIIGVWKLTTWSVDIPVDLNKDGATTTNLLDEVTCVNNETLVFDKRGIVASNETFNPEIDIVLLDKTDNEYFFNVICPEGVIGTASSYTKEGDRVMINDRMASLNGNKLIRVFKNAHKIYNEDLTEVIATKDLTLIYTKL
ncbi:hypothetical protein A8C32_17655 [Flavivirga aquatica]|uniref:Lipocalin-like domain-containing protein n=1 Tax=Flavivirga aquatica TaxID=1849968 RepID=A0A1E5T8B7_9FLAO|nr:hypothetical protein [Flavivirga aquatica]OEK07622.1 hypothetical protein A8C32_17655 [Flavivirga aquatica]